MPKSPKILADKLTSKYKRLDLTRKRVDKLYSENKIALRDKKHFYEGLYLKVHVLFETFIEDLFYGLLIQNSSIITPNKIVPRVEIKSPIIARELVQGGKDYKDWIPYERTIETANLLFRNGIPFNGLSPNDKKDIYKSHVIRNVIAHESKHSLKKFEQHVIGTTTVHSSERKPAGYLMGIFATNPSQSRFELYTAKLRNVAIKLTT